jgi:hypothetical protein
MSYFSSCKPEYLRVSNQASVELRDVSRSGIPATFIGTIHRAAPQKTEAPIQASGAIWLTDRSDYLYDPPLPV